MRGEANMAENKSTTLPQTAQQQSNAELIERFLSLKEVEQFLDESQPGAEYGPVKFPGYSGQWGTPSHVVRRDQAMLELLYAGGLRASEVATARVADLNLEARILMVCGKGS